MKIAILWTERARRDLFEIGDLVARDKPGSASKLIGEILDAVGRTALFPASSRIVPEFGRSDLREVIIGNYRVVYQLDESTIVVLTVFECHRLIDESLAEQTKNK
jgi:plasmid stabilization system protein ParE